MTFSSATTSAEREPPPNRDMSPKVSPGPKDATRRRFSPVWVGTVICTLTVPRASTKKSLA